MDDRRPEDFEPGSLRVEETKNEPKKLQPAAPIRAGGVYIPPWKMEKMMNEMKNKDKNSKEYQRYMWENLRKSINGLINKVNVSNIQNIILELFNENIIRGRGLLTKAIFKAQMASPNFTHVYAALVAVLNTKLPEVVKLLISRYIIQFQKAYKRNNKIVCMASIKMLAHLVNQQVVHEVLALEILSLFLENPTEDSIEMGADFMIECGQVLTDLTPQGVIAVFERFKGILHEGECSRRVQYTIESLFNVRKSKFKTHPGVIPELDLIEEEDRITHEVSLTDDLDPDEKSNFFQFDPDYEKSEAEWDVIKKEILGEEEERINKRIDQLDDEEESSESEEEKIEDITEQDLMNLRKTIYLVIASSVDFEEAVHKLMKMNIREGQEVELCNMIVECCTQERTYLRFFGNIGERLCLLNPVY
jgi:pre-mRNA-splicing factor CWC22